MGTACYTVHWGKHNWAGAQDQCKSNGGNLASVKSQDEAQLLGDLLAPDEVRAPGLVKLWMGLRREKGKCYQRHQRLRGFSWASGGDDADYSKWHTEPRETCTAQRCVTLRLDLASRDSWEPTWTDGPCNDLGVSGYVCKFSFQGMCRQVALAGPGSVTYSTPFGAESAALQAVPFGSLATVECGPGGEQPGSFFVCQKGDGGVFMWSSPGPLCAGPEGGCAYRNGGCEQRCRDLPGGAVRCSCEPGQRLGADGVSCAAPDPCLSAPCGAGTCVAEPGGFQCRCPPGYAAAAPAPAPPACTDLDECAARPAPCKRGCRNTPGGFSCTCPAGWALARDGASCLPATTPSITPGTTLGITPGTTPGITSSSTPGITPSTTPGITSRMTVSTSPGSTARRSALPSGAAGGRDEPAPSPEGAGRAEDGSRVLLYYLAGSLALLLLLLACALLVVARQRRRRAGGQRGKARSAADGYCWVPEQAPPAGTRPR